jgi:FkbM family methyltransferase
VNSSEQVGAAIARTGLYEPAVTEVIWRLSEGDDLAVDVGANVGYFSALLSTRVRRVLAVEAHPAIAERLRSNASMWPSVEVHEVAASDSEREASLAIPANFSDNQGQATLEADSRTAAQVPVRTTTLDALIRDADVGVLKIDVEGHEFAALRGAAEALGTGRIRDVIFEDHDPLPTAVSSLLESHAFEIFSLQEQRGGVALGPPDGPAPRWHAPTFLATRDAMRSRRLIRPNGWESFRRGG